MKDYVGMIGMTMLASMIRGLMLQTKEPGSREERAQAFFTRICNISGGLPTRCLICNTSTEEPLVEHLVKYDCLEIADFLISVKSPLNLLPVETFSPHALSTRTAEEVLYHASIMNSELRVRLTESIKLRPKEEPVSTRRYEEDYIRGPSFSRRPYPAPVDNQAKIDEVREKARNLHISMPERVIRILATNPDKREASSTYVGYIGKRVGKRISIVLRCVGFRPSHYTLYFIESHRTLSLPFKQTEDFLESMLLVVREIEKGRKIGRGRHMIIKMEISRERETDPFISLQFGVSSLKSEKDCVLIEVIDLRKTYGIRLFVIPLVAARKVMSIIGSDYYERTKIVGQLR